MEATFWTDTQKHVDAIHSKATEAHGLLTLALRDAVKLPQELEGRADVFRCLQEALRWTQGVSENLPEQSQD